jgi:hypothetical protein
MMKFIAMLLVLSQEAVVSTCSQILKVNTLKEKQPLYWVNPMDPADKRPSPAKDTMGMDFIPVYEEKAQGQGQLAQLQYHRKYSRILVFVSIKSNELLLIRKLILLDMWI